MRNLLYNSFFIGEEQPTKAKMEANTNKGQKIFLLFIAFLISLMCFSQKTKTLPFNIDSVSRLDFFFENEINKLENKSQMDSLCLQSVFFIKFKIDKEGKPINIQFNQTLDSNITKVMKQILISSTNFWKPSMYKNKPCLSDDILLPIFFSWNTGCKIDKEDPYQFQRFGFFNLKKSLNKLTDFSKTDNKNAILNNCIVLHTLTLMPQIIDSF